MLTLCTIKYNKIHKPNIFANSNNNSIIIIEEDLTNFTSNMLSKLKKYVQ